MDDIRPGTFIHDHAVAWPAVLAGAVVASAITLTLLLLGSALGFTAASPWPNQGASLASFTVWAAIWLIIMQWVSSALGGYVAGRLRRRWSDIHENEVFFRDTAHGFLVWALGTLIVFTVGALAASGMARTASEAGATVLAGAAAGASANTDRLSANTGSDYFVDKLLRGQMSSDRRTQTPPEATADLENSINADALRDVVTTEALSAPYAGAAMLSKDEQGVQANRLLTRSMQGEGLDESDRAYLAELVAARTGMSRGAAQVRVNEVLSAADEAQAQARHKADEARKNAAGLAFFGFISLLLGAFIASVSAVIGGRQRDEEEAVSLL